jgi:hypothetical protein
MVALAEQRAALAATLPADRVATAAMAATAGRLMAAPRLLATEATHLAVTGALAAMAAAAVTRAISKARTEALWCYKPRLPATAALA